MPTYDFECGSCGHSYERNLKIAERDEPQTCPECFGTEVKRVIGGAPLFGDPLRMGTKKVPGGWKEVLQKINSVPGSRLRESSSVDF